MVDISTVDTNSINSFGAKKVGVGTIYQETFPKTYRSVCDTIGALLVVEQSSLESLPRGGGVCVIYGKRTEQ